MSQEKNQGTQINTDFHKIILKINLVSTLCNLVVYTLIIDLKKYLLNSKRGGFSCFSNFVISG